MRLNVNNLSFSYHEKDIVQDITFHVDKNEFVGLIGPNGSGKSTILKNVYRALSPDKGTILLDNKNVFSMSYRQSALKLAVVGQENDVPFDFSVEEIVAMGRSPHKKLFDTDTPHDKVIVQHALKHLGMEKMAKRSYSELSGGEKQRVMIARAIAQESDFLILDEPTNHLDIRYQMEIFDLIKRLKVTVLSAIHDLNMAALYCDRIYIVKNGRILLHGTPEEIFTPYNIYETFGVKCSITRHPITKKLSITFLPEN